MTRSKAWATGSLVAIFIGFAISAEKRSYPEPRFPSYVRPPKSVDEIMPFARAAVRQTGGRTPLGRVNEGTTVLLVTDTMAEEIVLRAIKRAYEERRVQVQIVPEYELVNIQPEEARKAKEATRDATSEDGYLEARTWIEGRFSDPQIPKQWLKERRPDLYKAMFETNKAVDAGLQAIADKLSRNSLAQALIKYLDSHSEVQAVFFQRSGGRSDLKRMLGRHGDKFLGNFMFDNRWEVMNKAITFPADVWRLAEERTIEPVAWLDQVHVEDPEGTDFTFEVNESQALAWASGVYQQGHLYMFPHHATGRFPYSRVEYPAVRKEYNPRFLLKVNGVFAGDSNHFGFFPRIEVHVKNGYVTDVKGGGTYGEIWREFLKYPKINEVTYPFHSEPGYWWIYESAFGTNPKFFRRPDENMQGENGSERNKAGVVHWGFGLGLTHSPDKPAESDQWVEFAKKNGLPHDHWWHVHNVLATFRVRIRGTKNSWLTLIDRGKLTSYRSPEVRALASRYGDPEEVIGDDWVPHIPGINAPGKYEEFAKNPWQTHSMVIKKIENGTYEYFYPALNKAKK
jgi:hypothetical protein